MSIGSKLKEIRKSKGLTQRTVAEALGISKPVLSQYESDQRTPSVDRLVTLARFYHASLDYICENVTTEDKKVKKIKAKK